MSKRRNRNIRTSPLPQPQPPNRLARFKPSRAQIVSGALIFSAGMLAFAVVPNSFTVGTTISSAAMNDNFSALDARIALLEAKLASVTNETVNGQPTVRFTGVNVQVVNGLNATATANGSGNLIVGYDEALDTGTPRCTIGTDPVSGVIVVDETACTAAGGSWLISFKTGSHYIVSGSQNNYSRWGGFLAGNGNTSNYDYASVSGGQFNIASGQYASVSGGQFNTASGQYASVSGGQGNTASGQYASVSGGQANTVSSSFASVSGGRSNTASGEYASVSGGRSNTASGHWASVSGGQGCTTAVTYKWTVGGLTAGCSATLGN
ncbi:MAG: hypothetical protein HZB47_02705 [Nitrosomonadales bacterium]|nr:hypothetical protein [Nitrosomonadales bacterium]